MPAFEQRRSYGALRTALITYGAAAFTYLLTRPGSADEARAFGVGGSASTFVLGGLVLQVLLVAARALIKRLATDRPIAAQAFMTLELIGDGVTVLLFALATPGAVTHVPEQF